MRRIAFVVLLLTSIGTAGVDSWTDAKTDPDVPAWDGPPEIGTLETVIDTSWREEDPWDTAYDPTVDPEPDEIVFVEDSHDMSADDPVISDVPHTDTVDEPWTDTPADPGLDPVSDSPADSADDPHDDDPPTGEIEIVHDCGCSMVE